MTSVRRGRAPAESRTPTTAPPEPTAPERAAPGVLAARREQALQRALDAARFPLARWCARSRSA